MHRLHVINSTNHVTTRLIILLESVVESFHIPTHCLNGRTESSNQPSSNRHSPVELASNFQSCVPPIANDFFAFFQCECKLNIYLAIELLRQLWQLALVLPPPSSHLNRGFALSHKVRAWSQSPQYLRLHTLGSYRRSFHLDT